jgi:2-(1,2-epoxy-1,2-dihydrophenyl)acetyl-CoA isomerase
MDERVTYDCANGVAVLMLNRAERRNAIDRWMLQALIAALRQANEDPQARVVALTGRGRGFCAGLDMDENRALDDEAGEEYARTCGQLLLRAAGAVRKPIIVAAHGVCSGLGASLALACDMRVMSDDTVLDRPNIGVGAGGRCRGFSPAILVMAGRSISPADRLTAMRCRAWAGQRVLRETLMAEAMRIASTLAAQPAHALSHAKSALRDAIGMSLMDAVANDAHLRRLEREAGEIPRLPQPASARQGVARV